MRLTLQSKFSFIGALVPVKSALWVCHLWKCFCDALFWSEADYEVCWFWGLLGGVLV